MASVFVLSQAHGRDAVVYDHEYTYTDRQHQYGVVTLQVLELGTGGAAVPCVLKVVGFHAQLCFTLAKSAASNPAALGRLQEHVDAGLHRSYEADEREHGMSALLLADARYTAAAPALHNGLLLVHMKRGADCTEAVKLVERFFEMQSGARDAKLSRSEHKRPGWQALLMDADVAARIWEVQDLDMVAQFLARKKLSYGASIRVGQGCMASRGWHAALDCAMYYVHSDKAQVGEPGGVFANPNPGLFDRKVHGSGGGQGAGAEGSVVL